MSVVILHLKVGDAIDEFIFSHMHIHEVFAQIVNERFLSNLSVLRNTLFSFYCRREKEGKSF